MQQQELLRKLAEAENLFKVQRLMRYAVVVREAIDVIECMGQENQELRNAVYGHEPSSPPEKQPGVFSRFDSEESGITSQEDTDEYNNPMQGAD